MFQVWTELIVQLPRLIQQLLSLLPHPLLQVQPCCFPHSSVSNASLLTLHSPWFGSLPMLHHLHTCLLQIDFCVLALWWHVGPLISKMSFNSVSGCISHSSGSHPPNLTSVSCSMHYNLIYILVTQSGHKCKCHSSKHDNFSNDSNDFVSASAPTFTCLTLRIFTLQRCLLLHPPRVLVPSS
jgi:hypothetical protein